MPTTTSSQRQRIAVDHAIPISGSEQAFVKPAEDVEEPSCFSSRAADACLDWVVFPTLLFVQFGATMIYQARAGELALDWCTVLLTIGLFCCVAGIYRWIFRMHPSLDYLPALLLPEIFTNIILAIVMFGTIVVAYQTLVAATFALILLGSIAGVHMLLQTTTPSPSTAYDYQVLEDEGDDAC